MSFDREVLVEYGISDATDQTSIIKHTGGFPSRLSAFGLGSKKPNAPGNSKSLTVTVNFLDPSQVSRSGRDKERSNALSVVDRKQLLKCLRPGDETSRGRPRPVG